MQALLLQRIMVQKWSIFFVVIISAIISFLDIPYLDNPSIGIFAVVFFPLPLLGDYMIVIIKLTGNCLLIVSR